MVALRHAKMGDVFFGFAEVIVPPFANTPKPPYFVVCFSSTQSDNQTGYAEMAEKMVALAQEQDGYLGHESTRGADGFGITNSFWRDEASILAWKDNIEHQMAQNLGRARWYTAAFTRVAKVERDYSSDNG